MQALTIRKPSAWEFVTSSTGGAGIAFVAADGGQIYFKDPDQNDVSFMFGAAGLGWSAGIKLPKLGKLQVREQGVGGIIAPASFPNWGKLYILDTFDGQELTRRDIRGVCLFVEIAGGVVAGVSATAMLLGMDPMWVPGLAVPIAELVIEYELLRSATGLLIMDGMNAGVQAGAGAGAFLGGLW
jgi:hypothetical protein